MIPTRSFLPKVLIPLCIGCCVVTSGHAEVGASVPSGLEGDGVFPYILGIITEDNEPIGGAWIRYNDDTPSRLVLNEEGQLNQDGRPSILFNRVTNRPVVSWARNSASGYDIVYSTVENGAWIAPVVVSGDPAIDELDPHLTLDPQTGEVHLFYWTDGATPKVMHRKASADLSTWTAPVQVSDSSDAACRPAGVVHGGVLHVAYEVHPFGSGQTPRQIVLARWENQVFVPEVVSVTQFDGEVRPEVHSHSGKLWIDWVDAADEVAWTRQIGPGSWEPLRYEPYTSVEEREYHVRGAVRTKAIE